MTNVLVDEPKIKELLDSMFDYISDEEEPDYSVEDVERCGELLHNFTDSMVGIHSLEDALEKIKVLIESLNELNDECDQTLIETDQREMICMYIFSVLEKAGIAFKGDPTEQWREW